MTDKPKFPPLAPGSRLKIDECRRPYIVEIVDESKSAVSTIDRGFSSGVWRYVKVRNRPTTAAVAEVEWANLVRERESLLDRTNSGAVFHLLGPERYSKLRNAIADSIDRRLGHAQQWNKWGSQ